MANPIDKIKKLKGRSLKEIQTRGGQAVAAYSEKFGIRGKLLSDNELLSVIDETSFSKSVSISPRIMLEKFYADSENFFFPAFSVLGNLDQVKKNIGSIPAKHFVDKADKILSGRFDLLGFLNLDFGTPVDWHFEPISEKHSPVVHWNEIDEVDSKETGDKKIVWELNRHQHFFTLGAAYCATGNEKYAKRFAEQLTGWMDQNPPGMGVNWVSSLEVSLRAISWIWAFHLFRGSESMNGQLFSDALKFLIAHGRHIEKYLSTYFSPNTHLTIEALGLYFLGTQFRFLSYSKSWRKLGEKILLEEMDRQIRPDGVYFEQSTWYHRYTVDVYLQFLLLHKRNGRKLSSRRHQHLINKIASLLDCQMHFTRPDGTSPLIGDDDGGMLLPLTSERPDDFRSSLAAGAVIFQRGDYKFVAGQKTQHIHWLLGKHGETEFESLASHQPASGSRGFIDSGFYVMREGWSPEDSFMLVDAGEVGSLRGGHGHADTLSFELAVGGKTMLVDSGTYTYHKSRELRNFFRSTGAHNTLTIDERSSSEFGDIFSWESMAEPIVHEWVSDDRFDFFEGSHDGYRHLENSPAEYTRGVLFLKNDYWIMRDFVKTVGGHDYQQNFHFSPETNPVVGSIDGGVDFVDESSEDGIGMRLFTFGDNGIWQRKESWISRCYGSRINAPFLRYVSKGIGPQEFMTFMIPNEAGFCQPEVVETEIPGARAFVINYRDYKDLFVFSDGEEIVRTELFNTDFRFFWARMSEGQKVPEEFVMIGGHHFTLGGREILNYPNRLGFATARRMGNRLNVRSSAGVFTISLPQTNPRTYILKSTPEI